MPFYRITQKGLTSMKRLVEETWKEDDDAYFLTHLLFKLVDDERKDPTFLYDKEYKDESVPPYIVRILEHEGYIEEDLFAELKYAERIEKRRRERREQDRWFRMGWGPPGF